MTDFSQLPTLFNPADKAALLARLSQLRPEQAPLFGTMNPAQMMEHCFKAIRPYVSDEPQKQVLIGKLIQWLVRPSYLNEQPLKPGQPTSPSFEAVENGTFDDNKQRLIHILELLCSKPASAYDGKVSPFFGKLKGAEIGRMQYKHLDHHLRQFGA